jgi:chromosome segregation ATPase
MTGLVQTLRDTILIAKTDKRIWSAAGFLSIVVLLWAFTGSWRAPEPEKEQTARYVKPEEDHMKDALVDFQKDLEVRKKDREELQAVIKRTSNEMQADKDKINWHLNSLVDKLDHMTNRVDKLAKDIGTWSVREAELDRSISAKQRKKRRLPRKVDANE